mmetsp:Transcript_8665/g.13355  ORF Transcript_8665/g.13355 Transcript_8665/m.13355 type:complete len:1019 (+) Transcript_8665:68-3124(+)
MADNEEEGKQPPLDSEEGNADPEEEIVVEQEAEAEATADEIAPTEDPEEGVVEEAPDDVAPSQELVVQPLKFRDHHSLKGPSSRLMFQRRRYQVYPQRNSEFVLQHDRRTGTITARQGKDGSIGLSGLRFLYATVAMFMMGFLFVFCLQLLLFLFLGLVSGSGLTSDQDFDYSQFYGTLASIPLFVYSLACALALATAFVGDAWNGSPFLDSSTKWKGFKMQWINFSIYLGIPMMVAIISLFARTDSWWFYTAITWYSCVFALYCLFCVLVVYYEINGTMELIVKYKGYQEVNENSSFWDLLKYTLRLRQVQRYSGRTTVRYLVDGSMVVDARDSLRRDHDNQAFRGMALDTKTHESCYCKLTKWKKWQDWGWVEDTKDIRQFSIDETRDVAPFVTSDTWSLEKMYCRSRKKKFIAVLNGPNALRPEQLLSSFVCALIGNLMVILFLTAFLIWFEVNAWTILFAIVVVIILMWSSVYQTINMYRTLKSQREQDQNDQTKKKTDQDYYDEDNCNEIIYEVTEYYRINKITPKVGWTLLVLEVIFFYVWPVIALFVIGNYPIAVLFLITGIISLVRHYFNAASVLMEVGDMNILDEEITKQKASKAHVVSARTEEVIEEDFYEKSRLNLIVGKISHGNRRNVWIVTFAVFVGIFCILFVGAYQIGSSEGGGAIPQFLPPQDFQYEKTEALPYPTCRMSSDISIPGLEDTALMDFVYLSYVAYTSSTYDSTKAPMNTTQEYLDAWFGPSLAIDQFNIVAKYRAENKVNSAVEFKLITFDKKQLPPEFNQTGFAVISIRGTNNGWDALSDAQLWSAAWLAQAVRFLLPFGEIWNPILESLIYVISQIQTTALKKVAYYQATTDFVNYVNRTSEFNTNNNNLRLTGHSLGGGLAAITGSQTGVPAIALSGPNNMLSRRTFDPSLSKHALNTQVFNIVPDKDPVPRIDDLGELYQRINCTANDSNFVDCHSSDRSLCEIMTKCGTQIPDDKIVRPILCKCHSKYEYAKPKQVGGNTTYDEYCVA